MSHQAIPPTHESTRESAMQQAFSQDQRSSANKSRHLKTKSSSLLKQHGSKNALPRDQSAKALYTGSQQRIKTNFRSDTNTVSGGTHYGGSQSKQGLYSGIGSLSQNRRYQGAKLPIGFKVQNEVKNEYTMYNHPEMGQLPNS